MSETAALWSDAEMDICIDTTAGADPERAELYREVGGRLKAIVGGVERRLINAAASREYTPQGLMALKTVEAQKADEAVATIERESKALDEKIEDTRTRLFTLPDGDPALQREIRDLLRSMQQIERDGKVRLSGDPEILRAVQTGPKAFPLVSDDVLTFGLTRYVRETRPELNSELEQLERQRSPLRGLTIAARSRLAQRLADIQV
jgi:hypothetical protein